MYIVKYQALFKQYLVINTATGIAHSAWKSPLTANTVMADLIKAVKTRIASGRIK